MERKMFNLESIFESTATTLTAGDALICTAVAIVLGVIIAAIYMASGTYTKSFVITLAVLPALVQAVIMMVNGNLGTGIAVLGAFSLVRFRSVPGTSKEIVSIFFSMAVGLAAGMGQLVYAVLFTVVVGAIFFLLCKSNFGKEKTDEKELKITIPENLNYANVFDDIFEEYTKNVKLVRVKTTNLGSMFELSYRITMKKEADEKQMIDALRCRNGNLTIVCGMVQNGPVEAM